MEISTRVKNQANRSKPLSGFGKIFFRNKGRLSKGFLLIFAATLVATAIILWVDGDKCHNFENGKCKTENRKL